MSNQMCQPLGRKKETKEKPAPAQPPAGGVAVVAAVLAVVVVAAVAAVVAEAVAAVVETEQVAAILSICTGLGSEKVLAYFYDGKARNGVRELVLGVYNVSRFE